MEMEQLDKEKKMILEGEIDGTISHRADGTERTLEEQMPIIIFRQKLDFLTNAIRKYEYLSSQPTDPGILASERTYINNTIREVREAATLADDKEALDKIIELLKQLVPSLGNYDLGLK